MSKFYFGKKASIYFIIKLVLCLVMLWCSAHTIMAQNATITSSLISNGGDFSNISNLNMTWSVGETVIFTGSDGNYVITQGFEQPRDRSEQTILGFNTSVVTIPYSNTILTFSGYSVSDGLNTGLPISYQADPSGYLSFNGNTASIIQAGTVTVTASQVGSSKFLEAPSLNCVYNITKANQTIAGFGTLPVLAANSSYGNILNSVGIGQSGNIVSFTSNDPNVLNIGTFNNKPTIITFSSGGVVTITAILLGNQNYKDTSQQQVVTVLSAPKISQNKFFIAPQIIGINKTINLSVITATSGLKVTFDSDNRTIAGIFGDTLKGLNPGEANVFCFRPGSNIYNPDTIQFKITVTAPGTVLALNTVGGIIGKTTLTSLTKTTYSQILNDKKYTYQWNYSGSINDITILSKPDSSDVQVLFNVNAVSGTLYCFVFYNKILVTNSSLDITILPVTSSLAGIAQQGANITATNCQINSKVKIDCSKNYIKSVDFGKLHNSSGCKSGGSSDFTQNGMTDTLITGNTYKMQITAQLEKNSSYYGIWIDYNKNGDFTDPGEFIISSLSSDSTVNINNILIGNNANYLGFRKMRVGMQIAGIPDPCAASDMQGEYEEYLIYIRQSDKLQAPNMISPNDDGKNDYFIIKGVDATKSNKLTIMDRWGVVKYEKENYQNDWAGNDMNGNKLPRSTYFFFFSNGTDLIKGFVEVVP